MRPAARIKANVNSHLRVDGIASRHSHGQGVMWRGGDVPNPIHVLHIFTSCPLHPASVTFVRPPLQVGRLEHAGKWRDMLNKENPEQP